MDAASKNDRLDQRLALVRALAEELRERPLAAVRPADVYGRCNMSRSTFYRIFSSLSDIPLWYRNYGAELGMAQVGRTLTCREGHLVSLQFFKEAPELYGDLANPARSASAEFNYAAATDHVRAMEETLAMHGVAVDGRLRLELQGVAYGACAIVKDWLAHGMDLAVPEVADVVVACHPAELLAVFDEPLAPRSVGAALEALLRGSAGAR